jgi:hypothetical protein
MGRAEGVDDLHRRRAEAALHLRQLISGIFGGGFEIFEST